LFSLTIEAPVPQDNFTQPRLSGATPSWSYAEGLCHGLSFGVALGVVLAVVVGLVAFHTLT
jgi:hypothetical protein